MLRENKRHKGKIEDQWRRKLKQWFIFEVLFMYKLILNYTCCEQRKCGRSNHYFVPPMIFLFDNNLAWLRFKWDLSMILPSREKYNLTSTSSKNRRKKLETKRSVKDLRVFETFERDWPDNLVESI